MQLDLRLAQITDIHLGHQPPSHSIVLPDAAGALLDSTVAALNAGPPLDGVLVTGDLIDNGRPDELDDVVVRLDRLQAPWWAIPGNHDIAIPPTAPVLDRAGFFRTLARARPTGAVVYDSAAGRGSWTAVLQPGVRLVALDSNIPGDWGGRVDAEQCAWLDATLGAAHEPLVVVIVHHPLHPVFGGWESQTFAGQDWRKFFCSNGAEVRAILDRHPRVRLVLSGHDHMSRVDVEHDRLHISSPALGSYPLAYRLLEIQARDSSWRWRWQTQSPAGATILARAQAQLEGSAMAECYSPAHPERFVALATGRAEDRQGSLVTGAVAPAHG